MPSAEVLSDNYGCGAGGMFCEPFSLLRARDTCSRSFLNLHTLLDRRAPCRRITIESKGAARRLPHRVPRGCCRTLLERGPIAAPLNVQRATVNLVRDLFLGLGSRDVLTIGVGCDLDDYGVLAAVDVPVVVRDVVKDQSGLLRYVPGAYLTNATGLDAPAPALAIGD